MPPIVRAVLIVRRKARGRLIAYRGFISSMKRVK